MTLTLTNFQFSQQLHEPYHFQLQGLWGNFTSKGIIFIIQTQKQFDTIIHSVKMGELFAHKYITSRQRNYCKVMFSVCLSLHRRDSHVTITHHKFWSVTGHRDTSTNPVPWPCLVERFLGKNVKSVPSAGKKCPEIRSQTRGLPSEIE